MKTQTPLVATPRGLMDSHHILLHVIVFSTKNDVEERLMGVCLVGLNSGVLLGRWRRRCRERVVNVGLGGSVLEALVDHAFGGGREGEITGRIWWRESRGDLPMCHLGDMVVVNYRVSLQLSLHPTVEVLFIAVHLARPEPFLISRPSNQYASSHQETTGTSSAHTLSAKAYGRVKISEDRESQRRIRATPVVAKIFVLELKRYKGKLKKETGVWDQTLIVYVHTSSFIIRFTALSADPTQALD
ncbi:hypothetical protein DFH09DRAFT_1104603 [Mycena vulgaris]|nr:hypothetical protein DFH09DRAFT_1104603 [Mycena vulgaris]